ncbi:MAG: hypothetical protein EXQ53_02495, partial [Acidobacteria bacterium]|nr:hypothetical protein [Acidobacteriota bacterium]
MTKSPHRTTRRTPPTRLASLDDRSGRPEHGRQARPVAASRTAIPAPSRAGDWGDASFRHIVASMRNGVLALTREGALALINDEAYRIFGIAPRPGDLGRPIAEVLREHPEIV